jgi:hypothetical protein
VNQSNQVEQQVLQISVLDFNDMPLMSFDFGSRAGSRKNLAVGYYGSAQRYPFMGPGRPGISISPLAFCRDHQDLDHLPAVLQPGPARRHPACLRGDPARLPGHGL